MRGSGGPHGVRIWWPAGLEQLTPAERAAALERGHWADGDDVVTRDGRRLRRPAEARRLRDASGFPTSDEEPA